MKKAWYFLGIIYAKQGDYVKAIKCLRRAIELNLIHSFVATQAKDTITKYLQTKTATQHELTDLENWLQNRDGFEIISRYVATYRRVVFGKEEKALYELPKEQRIFFEREILKRSAE